MEHLTEADQSPCLRVLMSSSWLVCHGLQSVMQLGPGSGGDWLSQDSALIRSGSSESMLPRPPTRWCEQSRPGSLRITWTIVCPGYFTFMFWCKINSIFSLNLLLLFTAILIYIPWSLTLPDKEMPLAWWYSSRVNKLTLTRWQILECTFTLNIYYLMVKVVLHRRRKYWKL